MKKFLLVLMCFCLLMPIFGCDSALKKSDELAKYQSQLEKYNMDLNTSDIEIRNLKENFRDTGSSTSVTS